MILKYYQQLDDFRVKSETDFVRVALMINL